MPKPTQSISRWLTNFALILVSVSTALLFAELILRIWKPHNQFYSLTPGMNISEEFPATDLFPGLQDEFSFKTNDQGHRSVHNFDKNRYGILALGGSTTECTFTGDDNLWTNLLESKLNEVFDRPFTVGNFGVASLNSEHHLLQLQHLSPQYQGIETVLMLVGVNDFLKALYPELQAIDSARQARKAFASFPRSMNNRWFQRTELWMHMREFKIRRQKTGGLGDKFREEVLYRRSVLQQATGIATMPDLSQDIRRYDQTIGKIAELCRQQSKQLVLVTQPLLWHEGMTENEYALTAIGAYISGNSTLKPGQYQKGIALYNDVLRSYDSLQHVSVIDLAASLPQDTTVFYDYCHFNISGSNQVADKIFQGLKPLFSHNQGLQND